MRIPGVRSIAWCPASSVPASVEMQAMAGLSPSIVGIQFTALSVIGEAELELSDSNENNGSNQKVSLSFVTDSEFKSKQAAFIVTCRNGAKYLIGSSVAVPAIGLKDITAAPSSANHYEVRVDLSAAVAWVLIEGQVAMSGPYPPVEYEAWREITEDEITNFINGLD